MDIDGVVEPSWVDFNCAAGRGLLDFLGAFARDDEWLRVVSTMSTDGDTVPSFWVGILISVVSSWPGLYYIYFSSKTAPSTGVS